jgi:hypothetical protein
VVGSQCVQAAERAKKFRCDVRGAGREREKGGKKEKWGAISKTRMFVG